MIIQDKCLKFWLKSGSEVVKEMTNIKAIQSNDIQRLTSGQVIIDLSTAIKELVDNSIDANASQIDIIFKNYGVDGIECSDNGDGIDPEDYQTLAKRHYTSKISTFEDVYTVNTLGFRGEALSSLCSISKVEVITTQKTPKGTKLEFDSMGNLLRQSITSRNKGTTVQISELFQNLPVRRKEFLRTSKRQFTKSVSLLQSYAMIQDKIRITVTNITPNGKKSIIFATKVSRDKSHPILQNIKTIFGSSCGNVLDEVKLILDLNQFKEQITRHFSRLYEDTVDIADIDYQINVKGYISKNSFGCGRNTKDRQYIYINKRPIEYPSLLKCCNEVYRSFNNVQYPFVLLNFVVNPQLIDINVTPDKRLILLHNEQYVIDVFREKLMNYYQNQDLQLPKSNIHVKKERLEVENSMLSQELYIPLIKDDILEKELSSSDSSTLKRDDNDLKNEEVQDEERTITLRPSKRAKVIESVINVTLDDNIKSDTIIEENTERPDNKNGQEEECFNNDKEGIERNKKQQDKREEATSHKRFFTRNAMKQWGLVDNDSINKGSQSNKYDKHNNNNNDGADGDNKDNTILRIDIGGTEINYKAKYSQETNDIEFPKDINTNHNDLSRDEAHNSFLDNVEEYVELESMFSSPQNNDLNIKVSRSFTEDSYDQTIRNRSLAVEPHSKSLHNNKQYKTHGLDYILETSINVNGPILPYDQVEYFNNLIKRTNGCHTMVKQDEDIKDDIDYMNLSVNKKEFAKMEIVGQFNLGFIIVVRKNDENHDLFIVDQHASDEKYNFETLQRETVIECQSLITPQPLELNIIEEFLILENLDVFKSNGFKLKVDEDNDPGHKISLLSVPISKQTVFDLNDFNELIQLIKENDGSHKSSNGSTVIKCSKIRSMFAIRACRMSIMIGKPLTRKTMQRVVHNLSTLDKPWNCPHGRPTMRHLLELKDWKSFTNDYEY